jgi:hypothetical protein
VLDLGDENPADCGENSQQRERRHAC